MSKASDLKNKTKLDLFAINELISENNKNLEDLSENNIGSLDYPELKFAEDLKSKLKFSGKKLDGFKKKAESKNGDKKDIFAELIEVSGIFLSNRPNNKKTPNPESKDLFDPQQKIKQYAYDSIKVVLKSTKDILSENIKKSFFSGEGICGANSTMKVDTLTMKPEEIDFMNVLTIDPDTTIGNIMYEQSKNINKIKIDKELFKTFSGGTFDFKTNDNKTLFNVDFNYQNQEFRLSGLTQNNSNVNVGDFINDYFSSIETPNISGVTKLALYMTIQGDGSESKKFTKSFNDNNRLLKKIFSLCGSPNRNELQNQTDNLFSENDEDLEYYFDFDNLEGVDLEDEESRFKRVLKFTDCNNFETPVNGDFIEDFVFEFEKKSLNDAINSALNRVANDAYNKSGGSIPQENFNLSLNTQFIINLPKSMVASVLSPKAFLPIVSIFKMFTSQINIKLDIKETMKKLKKLFTLIIKDMFWMFIKEFWKRIKTDLINFVRKLVKYIIKSKLKRNAKIVTSLLSFLKKYNINKIQNCNDLFGIMQSTIQTLLSSTGGLKIPSPLLIFASRSAGFSKEKALMGAMQKAAAMGVPVGPINGIVPNNIVKIMRATIDGYVDENDENGYIKGTNDFPVIVPGIGIIAPGQISIGGKNC